MAVKRRTAYAAPVEKLAYCKSNVVKLLQQTLPEFYVELKLLSLFMLL